MKTVSNKKKVPLPQIRISDCVPYIVVPQGVINPLIPFSNSNPDEEGPSKPCKAPTQNKTPSEIRKKELTPVEEVEEYLKMEAGVQIVRILSSWGSWFYDSSYILVGTISGLNENPLLLLI